MFFIAQNFGLDTIESLNEALINRTLKVGQLTDEQLETVMRYVLEYILDNNIKFADKPYEITQLWCRVTEARCNREGGPGWMDVDPLYEDPGSFEWIFDFSAMNTALIALRDNDPDWGKNLGRRH